jgi:hypothetical protein
MMKMRSNLLRLSARGFWLRLAYFLAIGFGLALLRVLEPNRLSAWMPFSASCGAITGLPCLFCGMTRAIHELLNGNFAAAVYYNWLAFPILTAALGLAGIFAAELILKRKILVIGDRLQLTPKGLTVAAAVLVLLWSFQVHLAISQHKKELLNPSGPLYALLVK